MVEISYLSDNDLLELSKLFEELAGRKTNIKKMKESFQFISNNPDYIVLCAKIDEKLVGSLMGIICKDMVGECNPFMVIDNVIVSSVSRGKGIGKKLMLYIEDLAIKHNCNYIMFVSSNQRKDAHKFYESLGYKLDEVQGFKKGFCK